MPPKSTLSNNPPATEQHDADLSHVESWVFDLDNTLYAAECQLFSQIDAKMTTFIRNRLSMDHDAARKLQKAYYVEYGTTMSGLMHEHAVCPDEFLAFVHDIDLAPISRNEPLSQTLSALPGANSFTQTVQSDMRKNVAGALGIIDQFDHVFDIKAAGYTPKPHRAPYEQFLRDHDIDPAQAVMFEDLMQNLEVPHAMGMTTVLVHSDAAWLDDEPHNKRPARAGDSAPHIHYVTDDLTAFLKAAQDRVAPTP